MARLRREHHRLLGNGYCARPAALDCAFESICKSCAFFQTGIELRPTLQAQHDHAAAHGQTQRARPVPTTAQHREREPGIMIHLTRITHICRRPRVCRCTVVWWRGSPRFGASNRAPWPRDPNPA